jgi:uncharacterized protein with FMN-binding domain
MDTGTRQAFPPPASAPPIDPLMQARLARLTATRAPQERAGTGRTTPSAGRKRKRHPAKGGRAAAVLMSITTTAGLTAYFAHVDTASASHSTLTGLAVASGTTPITPATTAPSSAAPAAATTNAAATSTSTAPTAAATTLADGTYTGATATNEFGPVQVQVTISGGQITDVAAIQTPSDDRKSVSINARATPTLASEVLSAQSANIDTVSGATYTTDSYKHSLQSALDLARSTAVQASTTP